LESLGINNEWNQQIWSHQFQQRLGDLCNDWSRDDVIMDPHQECSLPQSLDICIAFIIIVIILILFYCYYCYSFFFYFMFLSSSFLFIPNRSILGKLFHPNYRGLKDSSTIQQWKKPYFSVIRKVLFCLNLELNALENFIHSQYNIKTKA